MVSGFIFAFSTIVLLKVIPEYEDGIFSKRVVFLQADNVHANKQI
jgi:hypothetical protein